MKPRLTKILIFAVVLSTICVATLFYLDWRIPRATATLQVHPSLIPASANGRMYSGYMESEFETALSDETLTIASHSLGLTEAAIPNLKKQLTVTPIRGSDFIKITAKDKLPKQAAKIANAVAEAYVQRRSAVSTARAKKAIEALDHERLSQEKLVQKRQDDFKAAVEKNKVTVTTSPIGTPSIQLRVEEPVDPLEHSLRIHKVNQAMELYEQSRAMLREMKIKLDEAREILTQPLRPITIHERAR